MRNKERHALLISTLLIGLLLTAAFAFADCGSDSPEPVPVIENGNAL